MWQEIADRNSWNKFAIENNGQFLQSFEFADFHESLGHKVWRLGYLSNELTGVCFVVKINARLGSYLYVPGGPILTDNSSLTSLITKITQFGKDETVNFVRFEPRVLSESSVKIYTDLGLKSTNNYTQPQCSQILDLGQSLEEIRKNLSESTRYNIGWVERQGVSVVVSDRVEDIAIFEKLLKETSERHNFQPHKQPDYFKKQFEAFTKQGLAKIYLAYEPKKFGSDVLAAAIVLNFGKTTTYLHAASSSKNPKLRAPYLMQWQIITDAKNSGYQNYDFWGVAKDDNPSDPWAGVSAFKKSFGGEKICYSPSFDLVLQKSYYLILLQENLRKTIRKWR